MSADPARMSDPARMDGRVVAVVGAGGGGIGTAVSRAVAAAGAAVLGIDVDAGHLDQAREAVEGVGGGARFVGALADVRHKDEVDQAFAAGVDALGRLDGLVNVVGGTRAHHWQPLLDYPLEHLDEVLDLNLRYALLTGQAAARRMIAGGEGGSIVNVGSVAGMAAAPYLMAYGAAKAALVSLTRTMAVEWGRHRIRANVVAPGSIMTPRDRAGPRDDDPNRDVVALKRRGTADELAGAVLFALSDLGSFMTGQEIVVDGGSLVRPSYLDADNVPVVMRDAEIRARILGAG